MSSYQASQIWTYESVKASKKKSTMRFNRYKTTGATET